VHASCLTGLDTFRADVDGAASVGPLEALIDTGADGTFVAIALLARLDAPIVYETRVRPHVGATPSSWGEMSSINSA
jgi:hypothetical protein